MGGSDLGGAGDVEFWRSEAEHLRADNVVLQTRVGELEGQVGALAEKVSVLAKLAFGKSSEKKSAKQVPDANGQDADGPGGDGQPEERVCPCCGAVSVRSSRAAVVCWDCFIGVLWLRIAR